MCHILCRQVAERRVVCQNAHKLYIKQDITGGQKRQMRWEVCRKHKLAIKQVEIHRKVEATIRLNQFRIFPTRNEHGNDCHLELK